MSKVFGIGFHKTGTSSLGKALEILGYKVCHGAGALRSNLGEDQMMQSLFKKEHDDIFKFAQDFDAFNDLPWFALYKELDLRFPNSKFILTERLGSAWLESAKKYFGNTASPFRLWLYGQPNPTGNEELYLARYQRHNDEVKKYFEGKNKLLVLNIETENKWISLCDFLNQPIPVLKYPRLNREGKR